MARVFNWQINREMSYWYPENRPRRQFAAIFDTNKCIACQTCSLACKTTWTSGRGQEYMFWNNVESKPNGFYPLGWDLRLLQALGPQRWDGKTYAGQTIFEAASAGERVLGFAPDERDYAHPNIGEDECSGVVEGGAYLHGVHDRWMFYLARICNHCTYPACLASCPRASIYKRPEDGIVLVDQKRCRGYQECVRACPYKKVFYNPVTRTSEKCIGCFPKVEKGEQPQCVTTCIGKIRLQGWLSRFDQAQPENPIDYLVHVRKIALPLFPQFGLEPNVYYIPPVHVPEPFLLQLFGPGAAAAVQAYRTALEDQTLAGLVGGLFGSTTRWLDRFKVEGGNAIGSAGGEEVVRVPVREPVHVRLAFDARQGVTRHNSP